jgi:hypothetical protein
MGGFRATVAETEAALTAMDRRVDVATLAALKKSQQAAKTAVKSGMRGRPRWDRRGNGKSGAKVNLKLNPTHVTKSGGPGQLTGHLRRAVGAVKRPKKVEGGWTGGVGAGGKTSTARFYRFKVEGSYPYMKPGVEKIKPKIPAIYHAAWEKATRT